jgi:uncharacterized repeat protein (TIGR02543 family)
MRAYVLPVALRRPTLLGLVLALLALSLTAGRGLGVAGPAGGGCHALSLSVGSGSGSVQAIPTSSGACPTGEYTPGYIVTVSATPSGGWTWAGWSGTDNDGANPTFVTMNSDRSASASFTQNCYTLTATVGSGSGSIDVTPGSGGGCPAGQYTPGYVVTVAAVPSSGWTWSGWTGTDNNSNASTTVTMNSNRTVTASFAQNCYSLTTSVSGGSGSIQVTPPSAGGCQNGQYPPGYVVTVAALPSSGWVWSGWTGTDNNSNATTTVTMSSNRSASASFAQNCYSLTTSVSAGSGSIQVMPTSAGGCPNGQYSAGYVVTVAAVPSPGWVWSGWTGTDNNNNSTTTVTMTGNRSASASFSSNCVTLTTIVGSGSGTISTVPTSSGSCPSGQYSSGYVVTLIGNPSSGWYVYGWSGTDNDNLLTTTITMNGSKTIYAYFAQQGGPTPNPTTPSPTATPTATPTTPAPTATPTAPGPTTEPPTATPPGADPTATPTPEGPTPTSEPPPPSPTPTVPPASGLLGDVNCGHTVDSVDAALVLQLVAAFLQDLACQQNGDVNRDGRIDAIDSAIILQFVAGFLAGLPP